MLNNSRLPYDIHVHISLMKYLKIFRLKSFLINQQVQKALGKELFNTWSDIAALTVYNLTIQHEKSCFENRWPFLHNHMGMVVSNLLTRLTVLVLVVLRHQIITGIHLRVPSESYPMNTNITGFRLFYLNICVLLF